MKRRLIFLLVFVVFPLCYAAWPLYQGLAYRGKLPMVGFSYVSWPSEQPVTSEILDLRFDGINAAATSALVKQQQSIAAPGYTAAAAFEGKLVWAGSVGWSDIANNIEMTPETQLRIGSTSKALTATALARLVVEDSINLDMKLSGYSHKFPNPAWKTITARQLASHTSGIPHYGENTEWLGLIETVRAQTHYDDVCDAIEIFDESEWLFEPGEQFSYSSLGTVLLSCLMQIKAEMSYQEYMDKAVLQVLGMDGTHSDSEQRNKSVQATYYWQDDEEQQRLKPWYDVDLSHRLAGGGWVSTSKDLAKLGQGFLDDNFIPASVRNAFWTPQTTNDGQVNPQNYGLGWRVDELTLDELSTPIQFIHHGGVSAGAQSFLMVIPKYKLSIAINANIRTKKFSDFAKVYSQLTRIFINEIEKQNLSGIY